MKKNKYLLPAFYINFFFIIGIISALAVRALIIFNNINKDLIRPAWYIGVVGYIIFFGFRYWISYKRKKLISGFNLIEKLQSNTGFSNDDKEVLEYLLLSLHKSRENINYLFIFAMSFIAIVIDVYLSIK
jgi:hypothetical protein